jgi:DNA-binding transcriptional LysR family regulator
MNTRFLATLRAVAQPGSLAGAGRQLNLATASVSDHIRALEKELNATLLIRRGRNVVLTEAGQAALGPAAEVLLKVDELKHLVHIDELSGHLRVGSIATALISIIPPALRLMAERHPRILLKVVPGTSAHLYRTLERGDLDCALIVHPPFPLSKSLFWCEIRREPLTVISPGDLPGDTAEDLLRTAPLIRMDRDAWTGRLINEYLADADISTRDLFEMDAAEAIINLVSQGLGVTLLPDYGIRPPLGRSIRKLVVGDDRYARSVGLLSGRGPSEGLVRALATAMEDGLAQAQ